MESFVSPIDGATAHAAVGWKRVDADRRAANGITAFWAATRKRTLHGRAI